MSHQGVILCKQYEPHLTGIKFAEWDNTYISCSSFNGNKQLEWTECHSFMPDLSLAIKHEYPDINDVYSSYINSEYDSFIGRLRCTRCNVFEDCQLANNIFTHDNQILNANDLLNNMKKFSLATNWN